MGEKRHSLSTKNGKHSAQENIITLFQKGDKSIDEKVNRDIVLILGNTGSGKSTLAQYIVGHLNHLTSVKSGVDYIIVDEKEKVSRRSTIISKTLYPELIEDSEMDTNYYDCPGFSDTRSAAHEITSTYFTKKIIDSARSVKLVFTVNHSSVRDGIDRNGFIELLRHATNLIKNIRKFQNSIMLVVTKVDQLAETDDEIISSVANFINNVKTDLQQNSFPSFGENFCTQAIEFIDVILTSTEGYFRRIGIFKRPKAPGKLSTMQSYKSERDYLNKMLKENIQYTKVNNDDFGFTVSDSTKNNISRWVDEVYYDIILELAQIEKQIIEYFKNEEQLYSLQLAKVTTLFNEACQLFSQNQRKYDTMTSQEFIEELIQIFNKLKINVVLKSLFLIHSHEDYLHFLYLFSAQSKRNNGWSYLEKGLYNATKYLHESNKWYNFLNEFHSRLSDYNIQKDISKYNIIAIEEKINQQNESVKFKDIQALFQDIIDNCNIKLELLDVREIILNKYKINSLTNMLKFSLGHKIKSACAGNTLTIQGHYIKLSDVDKIYKNCNKKITVIEILSLNKIFIDANLNKEGKKIGLIIISPTWDIINDSKIILDGAPGQNISTVNFELMNQTDPDKNGLDGQPGRSGGPAGSFFGIGKNFLKLDKQDLLISAVGGRGGNGGNGGNGKNGEDGIGPAGVTPRTFYFTNCFQVWNNKSFSIEMSSPKHNMGSSPGAIFAFSTDVDYIIYGRNATPGGNGGNAGAGGSGGNGGRITIIGLNGNSNIKTKDGKGKDGENGKPGEGGKGGKNSELIKVSCSQRSLNNGNNCKRTAIVPYGGVSSPGKSGLPAKITINSINSPETITFEKQYPLSINKFKNYLRSNLKHSLNSTFLMDFFNKLENNEQVTNCYDVLSLTDELQGLESQYYILHEEISLLPFYHSLLNRISNYVKKLNLEGNSAHYKMVLWYLHATILSKLSSINNSFDSKLVVDIKEYLALIEKRINDLKELKHQVKIDDFFNNYKELLENKTNDFNQFIAKQINPDIEDIFQEIMSNIRTVLVKEINDLEIKVTREKDQLGYKQKEVEQILAKRKLMDALQISSYFILSLSGIGITAIVVIEQGISISKSSLSENVNFSDVVVPKMPEGMNTLSNMMRERNQLLFKQLGNVNQELISLQNEYPSKTLKDAQEETKYAVDTLQKNMKDDENPEEIETFKEKVSEMLKSEIEKLKTDNNTMTGTKRILKTLNRIQNFLIIDPDLLESFKEDNQIEILGNAISLADLTLREITLYHKAIYKIIIPKFQDLKSKLQEMLKAMKEKSHYPIEVSKWKIQNTINDFFTLIYKMTKGFSVEEKIMSCIKKMQEGMMAVIDIYKTIENYQSESQLLDAYRQFIASKKSLEVETNDAEVNNAINKLDTMVESNLVLFQYQKAISMFKQYIFPFAHFYLSEFNLPTELQPERNVDNLVSCAVKNLVNLKNRILESNLSIGSFDKHINSGILFNSDNGKSPFFIWSYNKHKNAIYKLLAGKEIFLEADITKIRNMNAVKFNVIGLKFKALDKNIQGNLDKKLEDFELNLTHLGNSNYRCGDRIYIIKRDKVHFIFSLKMIDGVPIKKNDVYDKIKNDFMLSPYTMWSIKLHNISSSFNELKEFRGHEINLELQGSGQYVDEEINKSVCVDNMKNYYTVNEILSDIETVEKTYLNNTLKDQKNRLINHLNNLDNKRERRQLKNIYYSTEKSGESFVTNGGSTIFRESFVNTIFKFVSRGFESFRYLNPLIYINSWFELYTLYDTYSYTHNPPWKLLSESTSETSMMADEIQMSFQSNLVFWDFFLKKYIGTKHNRMRLNEISCSNKYYKLKHNERHSDFASSLAYNYYFNKYNKN
ncbi:uncharacterized protein [Halyomorpha halys]|uniref:uncharacterized protein n=1 Tax=Halyomorpha halys TaxID=286706 RepID=UPI0006D4FA2C|nr:uncharacterized protein LOC106678591 [Halyomorpha halys]